MEYKHELSSFKSTLLTYKDGNLHINILDGAGKFGTIGSEVVLRAVNVHTFFMKWLIVKFLSLFNTTKKRRNAFEAMA